MCNDYRLERELAAIIGGFAELKIPLRFSEGRPNIEPRADIRITDTAPIVRIAEPGAGDLVQRRWSWPGRNGPVYNYRSEGREFGPERCLILTDGFYEFTTPEDRKKRLKDKWLFTYPGRSWFCIAGTSHVSAEVGEAFSLLTMAPGPDVAPFHKRQIVILDPADWAAWLDPAVPAQSLIRPLPAGSLAVERVG